MDQILFYNTFSFRTIRFGSFHHTDNSKGVTCHYVARMRSGSAIVRTISGEELRLREGDIFYLPKGLRYHSYWQPNEAGERTVSWESYGFTHLPLPNEIQYAMQKIYPSEGAIRWLNCLEQSREVSVASVGYLYLFLSEVLPDFRVAAFDSKTALLQTAFDYIKKNENFTVPELARACAISESGLYALFRNYAHTTPVEIKHGFIAERAVSMLINTDLTVEKIAASLDLCSSAYLRRILKKQKGCTPSQIRKKAKLL